MANKTSKDIQIKDLDNWKRGQISYFSKSRMQEDALKTAYNVIFDYDAVVRPRGSFNESGIPDLPAGWTPLGKDFAFKRADSTEGLLNVFTNGTVAYLYVLTADRTTWQLFSAYTFNAEAQVCFEQIADVVTIGNNFDDFSYYEISTSTLLRMALVDDPVATPVAIPVGFSGTNAFDYYWRVSFNGVGGSTNMTPAVKVSSSTLRDTWAGVKSVTIDITSFTIDPDAVDWSLWVASVPVGSGAPTNGEYNGVAEDIPITQKTFLDDGSSTILKSAPVENTTAGIKAAYFCNISGRLWAISGSTVYWGGDPGKELYFGTANGSDSYVIDTDGIERPMAVLLGRDNSGTTCINLLTRTMAGQGAIWDIYATTNSVNSSATQSFTIGTYQFKKREGNDGTDAPFSVIHENNNAYYLSMEGFKSTGVKPNISGIQATDIISSAIRDRVLNLAQSDLSKCYAAYYDQAIFWTVAYGAQENNEIWMYDILHGGIWSIWRIPADCIFRWASTENESPSLYIRQGNKLLRYYKDSRSHADSTSTFESYIESGLVPFGESKLEWVHILKSIWQFDRAVGTIELKLNIHSKNGDIIKSKVLPFNGVSTDSSVTGGWDAIRVNSTTQSRGAWNNRSWNETLSSITEFTNPSDKKINQKVRKNAAYISFSIQANTPNTYYELSHLSLLFTYIGVGVEFLGQKGVIKI